MKILTWNINGIRAASKEIPLKSLLDSLDSDIICLQETKITREMLDTSTAIVDGYNAFFSFSKVRSGYSGVATYCKISCTPFAAEEGLTGILSDPKSCSTIGCHNISLEQFSGQELADLDAEGRALLTEHTVVGSKPVVVVNVYCPRADRDNKERWKYKQMFYFLLQARCEQFLQCEKDVIIVGDFNVSHTKLDHCDPDCDPEYFQSNESRKWMSEFLLSLNKDSPDGSSHHADYDTSGLTQCYNTEGKDAGTDSFYIDTEDGIPMPFCKVDRKIEEKSFVDLFRFFHPTRENAFTWWSTVTGARKTNYGTRIDYIMSNRDFCLKNAFSCDIRPDIHGSDHCPVVADLNCKLQQSNSLPELCSAFMPEFKGKQQSIKTFMTSRPGKSSTEHFMSSVSDVGLSLSRSEAKKTLKSVKRKADCLPTANPAKYLKKTSQTIGSSISKKNSNSQNLMSYFTKKNNTMDNAQTDIGSENTKGLLTNLMERTMNTNDNKNNSDESVLTESISCDQPCLHVLDKRDSKHTESKLKANRESDKNKLATFGNSTQEYEKVNKSQPKIKDNLSKKEALSIFHWKSILKGPDQPPPCQGHKEECVLRTVKKSGPNVGRQFYCCARPEGRISDKEARCNTFIWKNR